MASSFIGSKEEMKVTLKAPYFCQFDNELYPGGSCNMTSVAMALGFYNRFVAGSYARTPDRLLAYCDANGLDRHELPTIANVLREFGVADDASYTESIADVKRHLEGGNPVIIQGDFTPSGHVLLVLGFDEENSKWLVNDPAGDYEAPNHYSEPGWRSGEAVWYPSEWFVPAAAPDGKIWAHLLSKQG